VLLLSTLAAPRWLRYGAHLTWRLRWVCVGGTARPCIHSLITTVDEVGVGVWRGTPTRPCVHLLIATSQATHPSPRRGCHSHRVATTMTTSDHRGTWTTEMQTETTRSAVPQSSARRDRTPRDAASASTLVTLSERTKTRQTPPTPGCLAGSSRRWMPLSSASCSVQKGARPHQNQQILRRQRRRWIVGRRRR
jgi:hypothetical protein